MARRLLGGFAALVFVFLYAPLYHPAMKTLGPLRRGLGFRTILNLCGPLTNPAHARIQVVGVLAPSRVLLVGRALQALGSRRAFVVHGVQHHVCIAALDEHVGHSLVQRFAPGEGEKMRLTLAARDGDQGRRIERP